MTSRSAFTLLEICLAIAIAFVVLAISVPSLRSALDEPPLQKSFAEFDALVRQARAQSAEERRNYLILFAGPRGREEAIILRPEETGGNLVRRELSPEERIHLHLDAALLPPGETPEAIWTFWSTGVNEPATVRYQGPAGRWTATYSPFNARAEVKYE